MTIAQRFIAGIGINAAHRVPEARMNIVVWSTTVPNHEWLGYFQLPLMEQLQRQVLFLIMIA